LQKSHIMLMTALAESSLLSTDFRPCRHFRLHYRLIL